MPPDPIMAIRCINEGVRHGPWDALAFLRQQRTRVAGKIDPDTDDFLSKVIHDDGPLEPRWQLLRDPQRESVLVAARTGVRPRGETVFGPTGFNRKFNGPATWPTVWKDPTAGHELKCEHRDCRRQWRGKLAALYALADAALAQGKRELRL